MDLAGVPRRIRGTEFTCQCGRPGFNPWVEKSPWRMATYSSILSWKIPWTEEPGRLQFMGLQRIGHDLATECMHTHTHTYTGLVAPLHVGSSWIRDQPIPCTGGQILNHWTTRDTLEFLCKYNHTLCCPFKLGPSVAKLCPTLCDPMASLVHCNYSSFFLSVAE